MYRENPENLASEHTAYLDTDKVYESAKKKGYKVETDDSGLLLNRSYNESKDNLFGALSECYHLKRLFMLGFYDDIKFCLETHCTETVPILKDGKIVKL